MGHVDPRLTPRRALGRAGALTTIFLALAPAFVTAAGAATTFRINAGGPAHVDVLGNSFVADRPYVAGDYGFVGGQSGSAPQPVKGTREQPLYRTGRWGPSFSYVFDNVDAGDYEIHLYFMEPLADADDLRMFDVTIEGELRLEEFDVHRYVSSPNGLAGTGRRRAYEQTVFTTVSDGQLNIDFAEVNNQNALVMAIVVIPVPAGPAASFQDVASLAGVSLPNADRPEECPPSLGTGSAWADVDLDGKVDLYVTNHGGPNRLYRNDGDSNGDGLPEFTDVAAAAGVDDPDGIGHSAVFVDYDNDGDQDLYVTSWSGNNLYRNRLIPDGVPRFEDVTAAAGVADAGRGVTTAWADFNRDGYLDFYIAKHFTCMPAVDESDDHLFQGSAGGTFTDVTGLLCPGGVAPCAQTSGLGFAAGWADLDNDGDLDLYLVNDNIDGANGANVLWRNDGPDGAGGWLFTDVGAQAQANRSVNGMGLGIGDYDNDGWLDLAFSNISPNNLLRNRGNGTFEDVSATAGIQRGYMFDQQLTIQREQWTWGTTFLDFDNDGWLDVLYVAGALTDARPTMPNALFWNNGDRTFTDVSESSGVGVPSRGRNASIVDFDGDGFLDIFLANFPDDGEGPYGTGGVPRLFHNQALADANGNHWLSVTVQGTVSNRDGIGTRLRLTTPDGITQIREISSGPTHGGGDFRAAHFGLGANVSGELTVRWPTGAVQSIGTVTADQQLHLVEP